MPGAGDEVVGADVGNAADASVLGASLVVGVAADGDGVGVSASRMSSLHEKALEPRLLVDVAAEVDGAGAEVFVCHIEPLLCNEIASGTDCVRWYVFGTVGGGGGGATVLGAAARADGFDGDGYDGIEIRGGVVLHGCVAASLGSASGRTSWVVGLPATRTNVSAVVRNPFLVATT